MPWLAIDWEKRLYQSNTSVGSAAPATDWAALAKSRLEARDLPGAAACLFQLSAARESDISALSMKLGVFGEVVAASLTAESSTSPSQLWRSRAFSLLNEAATSTLSTETSIVEQHRTLIMVHVYLFLASLSSAQSKPTVDAKSLANLWSHAGLLQSGRGKLLCDIATLVMDTTAPPKSTTLLAIVSNLLTQAVEGDEDIFTLNRANSALSLLAWAWKSYDTDLKTSPQFHALLSRCLDDTCRAPGLIQNSLRRAVAFASGTFLPRLPSSICFSLICGGDVSGSIELSRDVKWAVERLGEVKSALEAQAAAEVAHEKAAIDRQMQYKQQSIALSFSTRNYESIAYQISQDWANGDHLALEAFEKFFAASLAAHEAQLDPAAKCCLLTTRALAQISSALVSIRQGPHSAEKSARRPFREGLAGLTEAFLAAPTLKPLQGLISSVLASDQIRALVLFYTKRDIESLVQGLGELSAAKSAAADLSDLEFIAQPHILKPPLAEPRYHKMLRRSAPLVAFRKCEVASLRRFAAAEAPPVEIGLFYVDLTAVAPETFSIVSCLFHSAREFLIAAQQSAENLGKQFALKKAILRCLLSALTLSLRLSLKLRAFVARQIIALLVKTFQSLQHIIEKDEGEVLGLAVQILAEALPIFPAGVTLALPLACDGIFVGFASNCLFETLLAAEITAATDEKTSPSRIVPRATLAYYVFEGRWQGWLRDDDSDSDDEEEDEGKGEKDVDDSAKSEAPAPALDPAESKVGPADTPEQAKAKKDRIKALRAAAMRRQAEAESRHVAMAEMLREVAIGPKEVERIAQCLFPIPRDSEGFILPTVHSLGDEKQFHSIDGFVFDATTGQVSLLYTPADSKAKSFWDTFKDGISNLMSSGKKLPRHGLFGWADIKEVFEKNVTSTFFSLDAPEADVDGRQFQNHPFQRLVFGPKSLQDTQFLGTMFHTDYLLKFFSTGVEISAKAPFDTRPVVQTMARLPKHLQDALRPISQRRTQSVHGTAHRFWIEAGEIELDEKSDEAEESKARQTFRFGKVKMVVKVRLHSLY